MEQTVAPVVPTVTPDTIPSAHPSAHPVTASQRPLALVTGASSGIGYELARQFALHGYDLIIASSSDTIQAARQMLNGDIHTSTARVETVQVDLATYEGVEALCQQVDAFGRPLDVVAINAGVGLGGEFTQGTDLQAELDLISLNVTSTVHLAKRVLRAMVARGEGRVLFTSSIVATTPGPFQAVYTASKAFVQSFAESLRNELQHTNITITALMPGPTDTHFFQRAGLMDTKLGTMKKDSPAEVARQGYEALMRGDHAVLAGSVTNKVMGTMNRFLPEGAKAQLQRMITKPGSAHGSTYSGAHGTDHAATPHATTTPPHPDAQPHVRRPEDVRHLEVG